MWSFIANLILRNKFTIIAVMALLTVLFGYYAITGLRIDNKYGNMLPKDSPTQQTYLKFKEMFGEDGSTLIIAIKDKNLYTEKKFNHIKRLGDNILQLNGVTSVISEAKLFRLENEKDKNRFLIKPIFYDTTYQEKNIDQIFKEIRQNPLYKDVLYSDKGNVSLMMVTINEKFLLDKKKQNVVIDIEDIAMNYSGRFDEIHFAGLPHLRVLIGKEL